MANIEAPSFSLGLDLDAESELCIPSRPHLTRSISRDCSSQPRHEDEEEDYGPQVADLDLETGTHPPRMVLKRLKRGLTNEKASNSKIESEQFVSSNDGEDDIEEFSPWEVSPRADMPASTQYHSVCSSSKVPLQRRVLTSHSSSQRNVRKREQHLDAPVSAGLETKHGGAAFPKLTISPLRRFQLLDSDSDDPTMSEDGNRGANRNYLSSESQLSTANEQKRKALDIMHEERDLWRDFCPGSFHIPTPALDDVCEEYFRSMKNKDAAQKSSSVDPSDHKSCHPNNNSCQNFEQCWDFADPLPPAHRYFFHEDPRIQRLVHSRLPNFSPLGIVNNRGQQLNASIIDYMSQFGNKEPSNQEKARKVSSNQCSGGKSKSKRSSNKENLFACEGWVDPKAKANIPKDAGKRRVHAQGQSTGHWYTSPDGRKVYVSKNGQELTGQLAYRHYRKESGTGFRKSKKKKKAKKREG